jgi:hypothetical protein
MDRWLTFDDTVVGTVVFILLRGENLCLSGGRKRVTDAGQDGLVATPSTIG